MKKLSLDALKERANEVQTTDLLATISGGTENSCHDGNYKEPMPTTVKDNVRVVKPIIIEK
jgi:hypothetical protein